MSQFVSPVAVALLWGLTTPFLRDGSHGIREVGSEGQSWWRNHLQELKFLLRWQVQTRCLLLCPSMPVIVCFLVQYLVPFLLNQCGSVLYIRVLSGDQLSIVVPLVNSLTFVFVFLADVLTSKSCFSRRK